MTTYYGVDILYTLLGSFLFGLLQDTLPHNAEIIMNKKMSLSKEELIFIFSGCWLQWHFKIALYYLIRS